MSIDNWIMIASALIVTIGWFVTGHLERKNEIAKELRTRRLEMLHAFYPIIHLIQEKGSTIWAEKEIDELSKLLATARSKFLLYGYSDEIEAYENVVAAFHSSNVQAKLDQLNKLSDIVRIRIRTELSLPKHILYRTEKRLSSDSEYTQ
jgi:hypothetical protein